MDIDTLPPATDVPALIAHVVDRFHEAHRRDLPVLVARAHALGEAGAALEAHLQAMAQALEAHMFKEEMRLFPMMEQGGSPLIGHLIDDLRHEHRAHEEAIAGLEALREALQPPPGAEVATAALQQDIARFVDDLRQHMHTEDDVLFPPFAATPRPRASLV